MKKLLSVLMLLNFAPIIVCSEKDLNKELAYETLTDASNRIANGIKGTIKAVIPGCTVACLTNEALKTNDDNKLDCIQDRFKLTEFKSVCAIPVVYMCLFFYERKLAAFFGAHAISGVGALLGHTFAYKKYRRLHQQEIDHWIKN